MLKKLLLTDEASLVFFLLQRPPHIRVFGDGANQLRWPSLWLEEQPRDPGDDLFERLLVTLKSWEDGDNFVRESTNPDAPLAEGYLTPQGKQMLASKHELAVPVHQPAFHMMDGQGRYR